MKILLAIDDSKYSQAALQAVISHYRPQGTAVRVIHVAEPITFIFPPDMAAEYAAAPQLLELRKEQLAKGKALVVS